MDQGLRDWLALALILSVLGLVSWWFSRRTYRLATLAVIAAGVAAVTCYGMNLGGQPATYLAALQAGGGKLATDMFGFLMPDRLRGSIVPGLAGWLGLLVAAGGVLVAFDTLAARRLPPGVQVDDVPGPPSGSTPADEVPSGLAVRRFITEELKFRLPAVQVRAPGSMPGGSTLESLATVVSDSGVHGSKMTAALMLAVHALEARPRVYRVSTFVERCHPDGTLDMTGQYVLVTVDLRDARTGQSVATRVLRPSRPGDAAEIVAGFTARQVFLRDVTTPEWAVGSLDGEDLSAYLLTRQMRPAGHTYRELWECRQRQRAALEDAVSRSPNAGLVHYELAAIHELDGRPLEALALHLDNRLHHPRFLRARYRLAMSLSMLADPVLFAHWVNAGQPAGEAGENWAPVSIRDDIVRKLEWAGLLRLPVRDLRRLKLAGPEQVPAGLRRLSRRHRRAARAAREHSVTAVLAPPIGSPVHRDRARHVLLVLARREFAAYRRRLRTVSLLWRALVHRHERAASFTLLSIPPHWWHPRRRLWAVMVAQEIVAARLSLLEKPAEGSARLSAAQERVRRRLRLGRVFSQGRAWRYGKVPWQALYNAACLHALPAPGVPLPASGVRAAVELLRLAITHPDCELDRPTEWLSSDPDLRLLHAHGEFRHLIREQASRDFTSAADNSVAGDWLRELLPTTSPLPAATREAGPVRRHWLRCLSSPRPQRS